MRQSGASVRDRSGHAAFPLAIAIWVVLAVAAAAAGCGGEDQESPRQPYTTINGGTGEVVADVEVPDYNLTIGVGFAYPEWDESANWRITVYAAGSDQPLAYVEQRSTVDALVTETWAIRVLPGRVQPWARALDGNGGATFQTGPGPFRVGISVTGIDQWSANVFINPPTAVPL